MNYRTLRCPTSGSSLIAVACDPVLLLRKTYLNERGKQILKRRFQPVNLSISLFDSQRQGEVHARGVNLTITNSGRVKFDDGAVLIGRSDSNRRRERNRRREIAKGETKLRRRCHLTIYIYFNAALSVEPLRAASACALLES